MQKHFNGEKVEEKIFYSGDVVSKDNIDKLRSTLWGYLVK
jgi:ribose transport system substrate-binding protein